MGTWGDKERLWADRSDADVEIACRDDMSIYVHSKVLAERGLKPISTICKLHNTEHFYAYIYTLRVRYDVRVIAHIHYELTISGNGGNKALMDPLYTAFTDLCRRRKVALAIVHHETNLPEELEVIFLTTLKRMIVKLPGYKELLKAYERRSARGKIGINVTLVHEEKTMEVKPISSTTGNEGKLVKIMGQDSILPEVLAAHHQFTATAVLPQDFSVLLGLYKMSPHIYGGYIQPVCRNYTRFHEIMKYPLPTELIDLITKEIIVQALRMREVISALPAAQQTLVAAATRREGEI